MSIKERIKNRKAKAERYVNCNKVFVLMLAIVVFGLAFGNITEKKVSDTEKVDTNINFSEEETEESKGKEGEWQFYWSDLIIFVVAGGFCSIKILQEKRRAKEELR